MKVAYNQNKVYCTKCGKLLKPKDILWLELSNTDSNYYTVIPNGHVSQGAFPFGTKCGMNQLQKTWEEIKFKA